MWSIIFVLFVTVLLLYAQFDMLLFYNAIVSEEEEVKRENYGKIQNYPEVSDFFCPTCGRHFSSYQHCYRHSEVRGHNKSYVFCEYSYKGLPRCHRPSSYGEQRAYHIEN